MKEIKRKRQERRIIYWPISGLNKSNCIRILIFSKPEISFRFVLILELETLMRKDWNYRLKSTLHIKPLHISVYSISLQGSEPVWTQGHSVQCSIEILLDNVRDYILLLYTQCAHTRTGHWLQAYWSVTYPSINRCGELSELNEWKSAFKLLIL